MRFSLSVSKVLVLGILVAGPCFAGPSLTVPPEKPVDFVAAEAACENELRRARDDKDGKSEAQALQRLAILKAEQDQNPESERLFRQALRLDGTNATIFCDFAKYFSDRKQYRDSETVLKNAVLIAPDHRRTLYNLGVVIASQEDRHMEGLRYLKLALGEPAAYRELAKICQEAGKTEQAEHVLQRAALLEGTEPQPSPESLSTPTVPMDEATKKELVEHIRRELLRQESEEIAEEVKKDESAPLPALPVIAPVVALSNPEPPAVAKEETKKETKEEGPADRLPRIVVAAPTVVTRNDELPRIVSKNEKTEKETEKQEDRVSLTPLPQVASTAAPLPESEQIRNQCEVADSGNAVTDESGELRTDSVKEVKNLPATEHRISNSPDALGSGSTSGEIQPLPHFARPLDDSSRQGSSPKYTAMGIKRIPETRNAPPLPTPATPEDPAPEDRVFTEFHHPVSETAKEEPVLARLQDESADGSELSAEEPRIRRLESVPTPVVAEAPIIRLGSVKNRKPDQDRIRHLQENRHALAERTVPTGNEDSRIDAPKDPIAMAEPEKPRIMLRTIAGEPIREESVSPNAAVSFRRTPPTEQYNSITTRRRLPNVAEQAVEQVAEPKPIETASVPTRLAEPEPVREERSELQFSSNRAPNVLRFEVSQNARLSEASEPEREAEKQHVFRSPSILEFSSDPKPEAETPARQLAENRSIPIPEYPVSKQEARVSNVFVTDIVTAPPVEHSAPPLEVAVNPEAGRSVVEPAPDIRAATHDHFFVVREISSKPKPPLRSIPSVEPVREEPKPEPPVVTAMAPPPEPRVDPVIETPKTAMIEIKVREIERPVVEAAPVDRAIGATKSEIVKSEGALQELSRQFSAPTVHKALSTVEPENSDDVGFATTRGSARKKAESTRQQVDAMLEPKEKLVDPSTFSATENNETKPSKAGFARSGRYSKPEAKKK